MALAPSPSPSSSTSTSPSRAPTTRPKPRNFPHPLLRSFLRRLLDSPFPSLTSDGQVLSSRDSIWERDAEVLQGLAERWAAEVRGRMCELEPHGWKYFCQVSVQQRTSHARSVLSTFWDPESDICVSEVFQNDTVLVTIMAVAVRIGY
ncbi:hypothetical protein JCM10213_007600 [Rhodosporidiobolus nylandii]